MIPLGNVTILEYSGLKISCLEIATNTATSCKGSNEDASDSGIERHATYRAVEQCQLGRFALQPCEEGGGLLNDLLQPGNGCDMSGKASQGCTAYLCALDDSHTARQPATHVSQPVLHSI